MVRRTRGEDGSCLTDTYHLGGGGGGAPEGRPPSTPSPELTDLNFSHSLQILGLGGGGRTSVEGVGEDVSLNLLRRALLLLYRPPTQ